MSKMIPIKQDSEELTKLSRRTKIINAINDERNRQDYKWGEQHHDYPTWLTILVEEVGEVAQAMQAHKGWGKSTDADDLYKELIQVAAVATAIAEQVISHGQGESEEVRYLKNEIERLQKEVENCDHFSN